jgi:hypothetical protein
VSARADTVFRQMMELDRCVVLLDEIDELVQKRDRSAQQLERFFTTTMLPRLSKLWSSGKILFFANTNNILQVDPAIKRTQRFDSAICVMPPGQRSKTQLLRDLGVEVGPTFWDRVRDDLAHVAEEVDLGWAALLRFDQIPAFAAAIAAIGQGAVLNEGTAAAALNKFTRELLSQDWSAENSGSERGNLSSHDLVAPLIRSQRREQRLTAVVRFFGEELEGASRIGTTDYWRVESPPDDLGTSGRSQGLWLQADGTLVDDLT